MAESPRIVRLVLSRFRQFGFCDIPLVDPVSGAPLEKVCFTGPNGVGKSTAIAQLLAALTPPGVGDARSPANSLVLVGLRIGGDTIFLATDGSPGSEARWFDGEIVATSEWTALSEEPPGLTRFAKKFADHELHILPGFDAGTLAFFSATSSEVGGAATGGFSELLEAKSRQRHEAYHDFLHLPENRDRTIAEVEENFAAHHPDPVAAMAELWTPALEAAQLSFSSGETPGLVSLRSGENIAFSALSPGLQRHLIRLATIHDQFTGGGERLGFLFLDDPEDGLTPDLARSEVAWFTEVFAEVSGQLFASTHSPRVASLFSAEERIALEFDEECGVVVASRLHQAAGNPAEGSEGEAGQGIASTSRWKPTTTRVSRLRRAIEEAEDDELADLIDDMISLRKDR